MEGGELLSQLSGNSNLTGLKGQDFNVSLHASAGVTCVLWLWTWGEIRPLPAPIEEHVHGGVLRHVVHRQLSDCQTNQSQLPDGMLPKSVLKP